MKTSIASCRPAVMAAALLTLSVVPVKLRVHVDASRGSGRSRPDAERRRGVGVYDERLTDGTGVV